MEGGREVGERERKRSLRKGVKDAREKVQM